MSIRGIYQSGRRVIRRLAHILARPVRRDRGRGGVLIQPYRGYGTSDEIYLMGRVFRQPRVGYQQRTTTARRDLLDVVRRLLRRGVADAELEARIGGAVHCSEAAVRVQADDEGYFRIRIRPDQRLSTAKQWHSVELELTHPPDLMGNEGARVRGEVFVPPESARRVIISDIDDTVMFTGVVNKAMMIWRLFIQGPHSRVAFPGVAAFYRALHHGPSANELNPMLYVSRAPWSIYEVLQEFFRLHRIPVGPILFLREWGIRWHRPWPRRAEDHKLTLIREMLEVYCDLPFVLIGDSGQHDPEIYTQVVREHPGRVEAVYIRNVSRRGDRVRAIEDLAKQVIENGSSLVLAADSYSMAQHAAEHGLIDPQALQDVLGEQDADPEAPPPRPSHEIERATEQQTQDAIERGELKNALQEDISNDSPPSVTVESKEPGREFR